MLYCHDIHITRALGIDHSRHCCRHMDIRHTTSHAEIVHLLSSFESISLKTMFLFFVVPLHIAYVLSRYRTEGMNGKHEKMATFQSLLHLRDNAAKHELCSDVRPPKPHIHFEVFKGQNYLINTTTLEATKYLVHRGHYQHLHTQNK